MWRGLLSLGLVLCVVAGAQAQVVDDLTLVVERTAASQAQIGSDEDIDIDFMRYLIALTAGRGPVSVGLTYADTDNRGSSRLPRSLGLSDQSLVLSATYTRPLRWYARLETKGYLRLISRSSEGLQVKSVYSHVQTNAVFYHPDGMGWLRGAPLFPSAYAGSIVNEFGRVQGLVGAGAWWKGLGVYGVGFYSFNGFTSPRDESLLAERTFGFLRDAGINVSASYMWRTLKLEVRRNLPFRNGTNDLTVKLEYRHFFR
ncbi:MAG: hypothetical protein AAGI71_18760 [Bacteroidota bacterium]